MGSYIREQGVASNSDVVNVREDRGLEEVNSGVRVFVIHFVLDSCKERSKSIMIKLTHD